MKRAPFEGLESILFTGEGVPFEKALEISQLKPDQGHKNVGGKSFNPHFTTCGRPAEEDITVIKDLGLRVNQ